MRALDLTANGLLLAMLGIAAISDLRSHRIPNWLVLAGLQACRQHGSCRSSATALAQAAGRG